MSSAVLTASPTTASSGGPFAWFQELVGQVPELVQPLVIALAGAVPFIEGEGSAVLGIIGGVHPVVAALAGIVGNLVCVVAVVLLGSRIREAAVARSRRGRGEQSAGAVPVGTGAGASGVSPEARGVTVDTAAGTPAPMAASDVDAAPTKPEKKGQARLRRWLVKFGVPGASLLAPLALPTMFTAATLVGSGVSKSWVILWHAIAIVLWTTAVTLLATGLVSAIG